LWRDMKVALQRKKSPAPTRVRNFIKKTDLKLKTIFSVFCQFKFYHLIFIVKLFHHKNPKFSIHHYCKIIIFLVAEFVGVSKR
jgi:hypothetical protein